MTGLRTLGEKRTQETLETIWAFSSIPFPDYSPLGVAILLDIVLALSKSIPELNGPVTGAGNDLPVISAEADRQHIGGVADETAGGKTGVEVPKAEGVVPRRRESELAVRGNNDVRDEMVVAVENALGVTVLVLVACQLPYDDGLVYRDTVQRFLTEIYTSKD